MTHRSPPRIGALRAREALSQLQRGLLPQLRRSGRFRRCSLRRPVQYHRFFRQQFAGHAVGRPTHHPELFHRFHRLGCLAVGLHDQLHQHNLSVDLLRRFSDADHGPRSHGQQSSGPGRGQIAGSLGLNASLHGLLKPERAGAQSAPALFLPCCSPEPHSRRIDAVLVLSDLDRGWRTPKAFGFDGEVPCEQRTRHTLRFDLRKTAPSCPS
jgi:hypothetical protein